MWRETKYFTLEDKVFKQENIFKKLVNFDQRFYNFSSHLHSLFIKINFKNRCLIYFQCGWEEMVFWFMICWLAVHQFPNFYKTYRINNLATLLDEIYWMFFVEYIFIIVFFYIIPVKIIRKQRKLRSIYFLKYVEVVMKNFQNRWNFNMQFQM